MPSHLTRVVFRRLLSNKPITYRGCLHRSTRPCIPADNGLQAFPQSHRRSLFGFSFSPPREPRAPDFTPGQKPLMKLAKMDQIAARPPSPKEIADAFRQFFDAKLNSKQPVEDVHVTLALRALEYLKDQQEADMPPWLSAESLRRALWALQRRPDRPANAMLQLAKELHERIKAARDAEDGAEQEFDEDFAYVTILSQNNRTIEARDMLLKHTLPGGQPAQIRNWEKVLQGFQRDGNELQFLKTLSIIKNQSIPFTDILHNRTVQFYSARNDLTKTKKWYSEPVAEGRLILPSAHSAMLMCCAANNDLSFGQKIVAYLLEVPPKKEIWDVIFLWSMATGKGVDEVGRMMQVMKRRNESEKIHEGPDIETINRLVEYTMLRNDPYTAERCIHLGEKWGIFPNAKTFIMQMEYRLSVNDIDGSRAAFFGLQGQEAIDNEEIPAINKLIQAMCRAGRYDFDAIMGVVDDLGDRKAQFEPETICELCLLHLKREEFDDAKDLLQTHSYHYSSQQRIQVRDVFINFCLDRKNSLASVWDTYQIFRSIFQETPREVRTPLMKEFFARERADMACHVFFHMKNSTDPAVIPNADTYVAMFTGIARVADEESLELVHNQMKLDVEIEPNTRILTSLMAAYAATNRPVRAMEFWRDITQSKEGPSYASIVVAFRACEIMPFGDRHAKPLWSSLRRMDVEVDQEVFAAYVGALAGNGLYDEAEKTVLSAEETFGFTPNLLILGSFYNATRNDFVQERIEAFIKDNYPDIWPRLEALGSFITDEGFGYKQFKLNRDVNL
ncbi:uncharacterized protein BDZ99DRAFT_67183 [Mytilinidion resinicola]|uniref:Complex I intermediate-associated protein 84, mitochondrial n=1 Tax=Mytilinidion resinicola TaxID=574789 RepID=A0A6A6YIU5_9PEZI|nr:uncharacterized protein BDZ99DRAFT_67183 [Mytilinidion resinicola]KAF2807847.1 hypothetical protein BDZ99DRAFT_67183 [Mytilinidion resinicola]